LPLIGANGWNPSSFTSLAQNYVRMKRAYGGKIVPGPMYTAAAKHLVQTYSGLALCVALIAQVCLSQAWLASWTEINTSSGCLPCRCIALEALGTFFGVVLSIAMLSGQQICYWWLFLSLLQ